MCCVQNFWMKNAWSEPHGRETNFWQSGATTNVFEAENCGSKRTNRNKTVPVVRHLHFSTIHNLPLSLTKILRMLQMMNHIFRCNMYIYFMCMKHHKYTKKKLLGPNTDPQYLRHDIFFLRVHCTLYFVDQLVDRKFSIKIFAITIRFKAIKISYLVQK